MKIRYSTWEPRKFAISSLRFDPENPRLADASKSEKEVIKLLTELEDLDTLLSSMANYGHVPVERPVVVIEDGKPIVIEGNRRLAAYKILKNERLAPKEIQAAVKRTAHAMGKELPGRIECLVSPDRAQANVYAYMKHAGEGFNKKWAPIQQAVFISTEAEKASAGGYVLNEFTQSEIRDARVMVDLYQLAGHLAQDPNYGVGPAMLRKFPYDAVKRTFAAPGLANHVGMKSSTNGIQIKGDPGAFKVFYAKVLKDMQGNAATRVYDKAENIKKRISEFGYVPSGSGLTPLSEVLDQVPAAQQKEKSAALAVTDNSPKPSRTKAKKKAQPLFDPPISGPHLVGRIRSIVDELEMMIPLSGFVNSAGVMIRVLLELTLQEAMKRQKEWGTLESNAGNPNIGPTLKEILDHAISGTTITFDRHEVEAIRQLHKNKTSLLSVMVLNQYVHNALFPPDEGAVRALAAKVRPIIQRCVGQ